MGEDAAAEEALDGGEGTTVEEVAGVAAGNLGAGGGVEEDGVGGNREDGGEFVGDDDDGGAQGVAELEDEVV